MNYNKLVAGIFAGIGSIYLLYSGEVAAGTAILSAMLAFFVGDANGQKKIAAAAATTVQ